MERENLIERLLELAIAEDVGRGDITTNSLIPQAQRATATFIVKRDGVISGLSVAEKLFRGLDSELQFEPLVAEGAKVKEGEIILKVRGSYRALLTGERTALNIVQRMSGIATTTASYIEQLKGFKTSLLDTRKTAPGMRHLDKMAVVAGGGKNHRVGLFDLALIKDNHIKVAGGITQAVEGVRAAVEGRVKIEVECTNLEEVKEALNCNADIIMLDNMENKMMREAVLLIDGRAESEASGDITLERVREVAECGVDWISVGALTHSVKALNISMNIEAIE